MKKGTFLILFGLYFLLYVISVIVTKIRPSPFLYEFFGGMTVWLLMLSIFIFPILFLVFFGFKKGVFFSGCALIVSSIFDLLLQEYLLGCSDGCGMINYGAGFLGGILFIIGGIIYFIRKK